MSTRTPTRRDETTAKTLVKRATMLYDVRSNATRAADDLIERIHCGGAMCQCADYESPAGEQALAVLQCHNCAAVRK